MSTYDETNRGAIWKNDKKETDRHPDFKGSLNVDGKEFWVSAWKRGADANPNAPALKFSIQPKQSTGQQPQQRQPQHRQPQQKQPDQFAGGNDFDDTLPF